MLQILVDRLERGMTLPQAIADPRVSGRNGARADAEPAFLSSRWPRRSRRRATSSAVAEIGAATGIAFLAGATQQAAAEPQRRGGGSAMVVRTGG